MTFETLQVTWFAAFAILVCGYAILDGFDLGVGIIHPLVARTDHERRLMLNTIGPVWDGNEVWLITAGGALFAGFPPVYASLASAFYTPVMLLLAALITRAVAIEFRSKQPMPWWRSFWDIAFSVSSFTIALCLGVVMGNLITGIPLDERGEFVGGLLDIFQPYPLLVGVMTVALFAMHGCIFATMKNEGKLHDTLQQWINPFIIVFIMTYAVTTVATLIYQVHMVTAIKERPLFFALSILNMLAIANIPREIHHNRDTRAFVSSALSIVFLMSLYAIGTFPTLLRASNGPETLSLTLFNASSSFLTLKILHIIACIGIPLVLAYTISIYWIFRGKVQLDESSY